MKRGPRPKPDALKKLSGTYREDRAQPPQLPTIEGESRMPSFVTGRAVELWNERIANYAERGLDIRGAERVLGHLCCLDATMEAAWLRAEPPTAAMMTALRTLSALFYEPPGSQPGGGTITPPNVPSEFDEFCDNPFAQLRALQAGRIP